MIRPCRCYGVPDLLQVPSHPPADGPSNAKGSARHCFGLNVTVCVELLLPWSLVRSLAGKDAGVSAGTLQPLAVSEEMAQHFITSPSFTPVNARPKIYLFTRYETRGPRAANLPATLNLPHNRAKLFSSRLLSLPIADDIIKYI
jgi:hypothetical protein